MPKSTIAILALAITLAGCASIDEEIGVAQLAELSQNAMSINAMSINAMSINAMSINAMSINAMSINAMSIISFQLDTTASGGIEKSAEGRQLLHYLARCALGPKHELTVAVAGQTHVFPGSLGLAPGWVYRSLTRAERRILSACLLSHVNHYGLSVAISLRGAGLEVSEQEIQDFYVYEATFYGDVFATPMKMYACWGAAPWLARAQSSARRLRVCSDAGDEHASLCSGSAKEPFIATGDCSAVCSSYDEVRGWSDCAGQVTGTEVYAETLSSWLTGGDKSSFALQSDR